MFYNVVIMHQDCENCKTVSLAGVCEKKPGRTFLHLLRKFINSVFDFGKFYEYGHNLAKCIKTASGYCEDLDSFAHIRSGSVPVNLI